MRKKQPNAAKIIGGIAVGVFATIGAIIAVGTTTQFIKDDL